MVQPTRQPCGNPWSEEIYRGLGEKVASLPIRNDRLRVSNFPRKGLPNSASRDRPYQGSRRVGTRKRQGVVMNATGRSGQTERSRRSAESRSDRDGVAVAMRHQNAAHRAVAFIGSAPDPDRARTCS
ncbi:hypothetical protein Taro_047615 [Colocasia esculenta]|uniref:Uncharacterized protein n=1 Tax=Colocasia esculenta TaxID=4460 RepID=A0A843WWK0_COLES|nr:hypothetical protein [Colocasia esculenta]